MQNAKSHFFCPVWNFRTHFQSNTKCKTMETGVGGGVGLLNVKLPASDMIESQTVDAAMEKKMCKHCNILQH